jgi:hypothetical protein
MQRQKLLHGAIECVVMVSQSDWLQFPIAFRLAGVFVSPGDVEATPRRRALNVSRSRIEATLIRARADTTCVSDIHAS